MKVPNESIAKTINYLEENKLGKKQINFRLKDWGISRQRYWGCPIPIAYDENNNPIKIPKDLLPVKLPEIKKFISNGNPLNEMHEWKKINIDGKEYTRETDTLDTFVDSSWFLRFALLVRKSSFNLDEVNYGCVDQYIGGVEPQFFTYYTQDFLCMLSKDNEKFDIKEPLKDYLHKVWFVMRLIDQNNNWVSPDEIVTIDGKISF